MIPARCASPARLLGQDQHPQHGWCWNIWRWAGFRPAVRQLSEPGLAAMHRCTSEKFGWTRDNTIGATPQINTYTSGWVQFWREHRLGYQLQLARVNGHTGKLQAWVKNCWRTWIPFFQDADPAASLLHGDLWSGNYSFDDAGSAGVI